MRSPFPWIGVLAFAVIASACAPRVHVHTPRPAKAVVVKLDREHDDPKVVVVHRGRAPHADCWKHGGHFHCRRH